MAAGNKHNAQYPLMIGNRFCMNCMIMGEISTGKSTLLDAIFGDCLAPIGNDRTTLTIQQYHESDDRKSNDGVFEKSVAGNINQGKEFLENRQDFVGENKNDHPVLRSVKAFRAVWQDFEYNGQLEFVTHMVQPSSLAPRLDAYDNTFNIWDLPGFNDKILDKFMHRWITSEAKKFGFDYIFYVLDCQQCLRNKRTEWQFNKIIKDAKECLFENDGCTLVILFNKFDAIENDEDAKNFVKQERKRTRQILEFHQIDSNKVKYYNVSANNLLCQRIIESIDHKFIEKNPSMMNLIYKFCPKYFSQIQIASLKKAGSIGKQLAIIKQTMNKSNDLLSNIDMSDIDYKDDNSEKNESYQKPEINATDKDQTDAFLKFLKGLRNNKLPRIQTKIEKHLNSLKMDKQEKSIQQLFICVNCLIMNNRDNNQNKMKNDKIMQLFKAKLSVIINSKLNVANKIICATECIELMRQLIIRLTQYNIYFEDSKKEILSLMIEHRWLTSPLLAHLYKLYYDDNYDYLHFIFQFYFDYLTLHCYRIDKYEFISDIERYFANDIPLLRKKLCSLLIHYENKAVPKHNECRAVDLMSFYGINVQLLQQFDLIEFEQWAKICALKVNQNDGAFRKLIQTLSNVLKRQ